MNQKLIVAWIAVFVVWMGGSFLVHGMILHSEYANLPGLMRTEADANARFQWMIAAHAVLSAAFVWIYSRGVEDKPALPQGMRFGLAVALVSNVPIYLIHYVVQPMPGMLVFEQMAYGVVLMVVLGVVAAILIKPASRAA